VVWSKLVFNADHLAGLITTVLALFGMTAGTLYQKRFCPHTDLRSATFIQNAAAGLVVLLPALLLETMHITWRIEFVLSLTWLCLVLSIGTMIIFLFILRRGAAARIASLFYLVPPVTAFMAYLLFGETLGATALAGMAFTAAGVALVNRG
jgi:drug/metabolite transporter (DMT)-like permease